MRISVLFAGLVLLFGYVVCKQRGKNMRKPKKNIYLAALAHAISTDSGLDKICKVLGSKYVTESNAYCWLEDGRTEREIVTMLRKIGYDIPEGFQGSEDIKFDCTIQED